MCGLLSLRDKQTCRDRCHVFSPVTFAHWEFGRKTCQPKFLTLVLLGHVYLKIIGKGLSRKFWDYNPGHQPSFIAGL